LSRNFNLFSLIFLLYRLLLPKDPSRLLALSPSHSRGDAHNYAPQPPNWTLALPLATVQGAFYPRTKRHS